MQACEAISTMLSSVSDTVSSKQNVYIKDIQSIKAVKQDDDVEGIIVIKGTDYEFTTKLNSISFDGKVFPFKQGKLEVNLDE